MNKKFVCFFLSAMFLVVSFSAIAFAAQTKTLSDVVQQLKVYKDIVKIGSDASIPEGTIYSNATVVGGNLYIYGEVQKDVVAVFGDVILKQTAKVDGNVVSVGGRIIKMGDAKIAGSITEVSVPSYVKKNIGPNILVPALLLGWGIVSLIAFVGFLALACIIAVMFPANIGFVSASVEKHPWKMLLFGILGIIFIPLVTFVLIVSIVGIPLIPIEIFGILIAFLIGYIAIAQIVGKSILKALRLCGQPMVLEVLVGMILVGLVVLIPIIGWMIKMIIAIIGFGAVIATRFATKHAS